MNVNTYYRLHTAALLLVTLVSRGVYAGRL
jgi:hypothetical protein